jgi:acyl carrier protein
MSETEQKLKAVIGKVLGIQPETYSKISTDTVAEWDSMNHLILIGEVEKEFGVKFTTDEVIRIKGMDDILQLLKNRNFG